LFTLTVNGIEAVPTPCFPKVNAGEDTQSALFPISPAFGQRTSVAKPPPPALTPTPVSVTTCGDPLALSEIDRVPLNVATEFGVNVTLIVQLARTPREAGQLFVCVNCDGEVTMLEMMSAELPVFSRVTVCWALLELTI
jgi:hypothetical protein